MTSGMGRRRRLVATVRRMKSLRILLLALVAVFATGCFRWAPARSLDEAMNASRVRIEVPNQAAVILEHPTPDTLRDLAVNAHARIEIKKVNAWAVALLATGTFLMSAFTAICILGAAAAGIAGG